MSYTDDNNLPNHDRLCISTEIQSLVYNAHNTIDYINIVVLHWALSRTKTKSRNDVSLRVLWADCTRVQHRHVLTRGRRVAD